MLTLNDPADAANSLYIDTHPGMLDLVTRLEEAPEIALDTEAELLVQEAIDRLMEHRTVFVVAHRLSTIQHADRIIVLDGGRIVEEGTHAALHAHDGLYRHLYDLQFARAEEETRTGSGV